MKQNSPVERLYNGIVKENPTFVMMLGMCPTLAVTSSLMNGFGMGLTTTVVLAASNLMISMLRKLIPDSLGIYIPLIVVNCIILGRAEAYASKNPVIPSLFDGIGMGLGFTIGLSFLGFFRELIGNGTVLSVRIIPEDYCISIISLAPGAFFVLAVLVAVINKIRIENGKKPKEIGCSADCANCDKSCTDRTSEIAGGEN